jgi:hypothetical protein
MMPRHPESAAVAAWIERQLAQAPELTGGQVERLRALLPAPTAGGVNP